MYRPLFCTAALLLVLSATAGLAQQVAAHSQKQTSDAHACTTLVYSANPSYPPYHWADGNAFQGASIELLKLVIPPGIKLKPVVAPWKRTLKLAESGEIDLLVSLRITPERLRFLRFTRHRSFPNPIVIFVRKERAFAFSSWSTLKPLLGGVSMGDRFGGDFDEYLQQELRVETAATMENNFQKLLSGRIDYVVTSRYVGESWIAAHRKQGVIVSLSPPVSDQDIHFGFSQRSACAGLEAQMSTALEELDRKGVLERLLQKHLRLIEERKVPLPE